MAEGAHPPSQPTENAFLRTVRHPRVMLMLLGTWNAVALVSTLFVDAKIRGPSGGLALTWQPMALAALYFYCARNPERHRRVFWLALLQQVAAVVGNVYHWGAGDLTLGSIVISVAVSAGLALLVFAHLFAPRTVDADVAQTP